MNANPRGAPAPNPDSLSSRLRVATRELHREAERAGVMGQLLRGTLPFAAYRALLVNLHAIYTALEDAFDEHRGMPAVASLGIARLLRTPALEADLQALGIDAPAATLAPATIAFCQDLAVRARDPAVFVAHAYVRYLGDLNGGQTLRRLIAHQFPQAQGATRFYDFGSSDEVANRIAQFRAGLDAFPDQHHGHARMVEEACAAFAFHRSLFVALDTTSAP